MKSSESFIDNLKAQIDNGKISDWTYDSDGDFSSRKAELCNQAWFHPYEFTDMCIFGIVGRKISTCHLAYMLNIMVIS